MSHHPTRVAGLTFGIFAAACGRGALEPAQLAPSLCMTEGVVTPAGSHRVHIDEGAARGFVVGDHSRVAELAFVYQGPSRVAAPLADGATRRQIGLKLRAHDSCNVVYVMCRIERAQGVVVQVKHNTQQSTHAECGATATRPSRRRRPRMRQL